MDILELALDEIKLRIKEVKDDMGIKVFKHTPTTPFSKGDLPGLAMLEGNDPIAKWANRSRHGYPAIRQLELILEIIVNKKKTPDIKDLYKKLRKGVFLERTDPTITEEIINPIVAEGAFIRENRKEGPIGYGLPDINVMRLVLDLLYTDDGF